MIGPALGAGPLPADDVVAVARHDARVGFAPGCLEGPVARARALVEALAASDEPHYGVSTGFGALATRHIPADRRAQLQQSLSGRTPPARVPRWSARSSAP